MSIQLDIFNTPRKEEVKPRSYRPSLHSIFIDTVYNKKIIVTHNFINTEEGKPAIIFRYIEPMVSNIPTGINGQPEIVMSLERFNSVIENRLRFEEFKL